MKDFTPQQYQQLVQAFINNGYRCLTYETYCDAHQSSVTLPERFVILRHDVDLHVLRSLQMAAIEHQLGVRATYYFRVVEESNQPDVIANIANMGHEIGYHYEDMSLFEGNDTKAFEHFTQQLNYFRQFYNVRTICMHGSPFSKYEELMLWRNHSYRALGVIGEPYIDTDFNDVLYLTDTGRRWDGGRYSVRDKVSQHFTQRYRHTAQLIRAIEEGTMPHHLMITTHPQRWIDGTIAWTKELVMQNIKNIVKLIVNKLR